MGSSYKIFCCGVKLLAALLLSATLLACSGGGDPDEEGGIIGTGLILRGTVSDSREFASNSIEIKSSNGQRFSRTLGNTGRYEIDDSVGLPPFLIRADLGNNEYRYGISYGDEIANVHSYSDVILRNWFSANGQDIDSFFIADGQVLSLPTQVELGAVSSSVYDLFESVLESYQLSGQQLISEPFDANNVGIDRYLDDNPLFIKDGFIQAVITDPETKTQSTTRSTFSVFTLATEADNEIPSAPTELRALPSALDEVVLVWDPAIDDMGVVAYRIYRDGVFVATTPFPVYTDSALQASTVYRYEVTAVDSVGNESLASISASTETLDLPDTTAPPVPVQLSVTPDTGRMNLIWGQNDIADVVAFNIYRSVGESAPILLTKVTSTVLTDTKISSGTTYCYQVVAVDASGNASDLSEADCADSAGMMVRTETANNVVAAEPLAGLTIPDLDSLECEDEWELSRISEPVVVDGGCYKVVVNVDIENGGNLTLMPGSVFLFGAGLGIEVRTGGSLSLLGEKAEPVVLSAIDRVPGFWDGVEFYKSNSSKNTIRHAVIEYAGGGSSEAAVHYYSASNGPTSSSLFGSLVRWSAGAGLSASESYTTFRDMSANVFTENAIPMIVDFDVLQDFSLGNDFSQNLNDVIDLGRVYVSSDSVLPDLGVAYLVDVFDVGAGNLDIISGVEVRFSEGAIFNISGSVRTTGDMEEILFTGSSKQPGHWVGLRVSGTAYLSNVRIEYAGQLQVSTGQQSNLELISGGTVALDNVSLQYGLNYGFSIDKGNVLAANTVDVSFNGIAGKIDFSEVNNISEGFWFSENANNAIHLRVSRQVIQDLTLKYRGADYQFDRDVSINSGGVLIEPGVSIFLKQGVEFEILNNSYLRAIGTIENPILFSSLDSGLPWNGIYVNGSSNELNMLSNVTIENAGAGDLSAAVYLQCSAARNAYLKISDSSIRNSNGWGISIGPEGCVMDLVGEIDYSGNKLGNLLFRE